MPSKNFWLGVVLSLVPMTALASACKASDGSMVFIGDDCDGPCEGPTTSFVSDAGSDVDATIDAPAEELLCKGTECPAPYATCGDTESFKCETNLRTDNDHCGSCGNACPLFEALHMRSRCVKGACAAECIKDSDSSDWKDCNAFLDDGCEINIGSDPKNCGSCGHQCPEGDLCNEGRCGCEPPTVLCMVPGRGGVLTPSCSNLASDNQNCGACGTVCNWPADACETMPPNTTYGCVASQCGKLTCNSGAVGDCDYDLGLGCASNGCESDVTKDPKNCGACGVVCGTDQECRDDGQGPNCYDKCELTGRAYCEGGCADLLSNPKHCGSCGTVCPVRDHQIPQCLKGVCEYRCEYGWEDCDGDPNNGCEANTQSDPTHCGGCGTTCDHLGGQPCIEGKCLMVDCDAGPVTK